MTVQFDWSEQPGPWNLWRLFDVWRSKYDEMTLQDQIDFHREFYARWTVIHQHGDDRPVAEFFDYTIGQNLTVLEIGGWTGDAADAMLRRHDNIVRWTNIEICREAVDASIPKDDRYLAYVPDHWPWEDYFPGFKVLFMQHVIEHMKFAEFQKLLDACPDIEWVFIQSPLNMDGQEWVGYPGCHILEVGWDTIDAEMESRGFALAYSWWDTQHSTAPENGRTRIYRRNNAVFE